MKKLIYVFTVSLLLIAIAFSDSMAAHNKQQKQHWGTPYSINYLAKNHKLIEANKAFNNTKIYFTAYLPPNTYLTSWTITFDDGTNTYELQTDPNGYYNPPYYEDSWSDIPQGTYTVTIHSNGYANTYIFDAILDYVDANGQLQSPYIWDKHTDYADFVFQNIYVCGGTNSLINIYLAAHN
ncbi:peptidase associated/transthyretin-like domain-containing protein [Mucilaginibacter aquatilis]|uniref:Uncharacterized protein n=1 Tax=Mucilaginibacter aquatilis TaxID=1517760 RepID=A0A6I4IAN1_9SPHI|nr:carboxypeptidase-like regulatory domain-containing protein [Mucilaginibacter aquatilis]MVN90566.1 hypothetical protein [Mucilaginibacter aquatilis]